MAARVDNVVNHCIALTFSRSRYNFILLFYFCPSSSKWVPGGNTGEVIGGEKRKRPPYLTMPMAQDKFPPNRHSPNVRNRARDSPLPFLL